MPSGSSVPSLVFKTGDEGSFAPSDLARKVAKNAILSKAAEFDCSQGIGDDFSLFGVVGSGASFEDF